MGSAQDIMKTFVSKDFHRKFPALEGWKLETAGKKNLDITVYRASRYHRGQQQQAILAVSFDPQPSTGCIRRLSSVNPDSRYKTGRYLLVPRGADVSTVPPGIDVINMKAFGFSNGKLVWLTKKKNAVRYSQNEYEST